MSDDVTPSRKVFQFPQKEEVSDEEHNRRIVLEADRLASLSPGEWLVWYRGKAEQLGIAPDKLAELVKEKIAAREKAAAEKLAQDKLGEQKAERLRKVEAQAFRAKVREEDAAAKKTKAKSKAFADIIKLPADEHDAAIEVLAKSIAEDVEALKAEFGEYCAAEIASSITPSDSEEPWPDPVATAQLLEELILRINAHIVAKPHEVLIIALWTMMCWIHEEAAHYSPYLAITSTVPGCGKTTLLTLLGQLTPRPYSFGAATAASVFRVIDREKPVLLGDNIDTLFKRKPDLTEIFLIAHTRGLKIPRAEKIQGDWITRWFDPFCPKAVTLVGTELPEALLGRSIVIELWKMKKGETVAKVDQLDAGLMDEFKTLRRKLRRWADDHAAALKTAKPTMPTAFLNRPADLWILPWAIADMVNDEWGQLARNAAERLSEDGIVEPSWIERLVEEFWAVFVEKQRDRIPSEDLIKLLTADPLSIWHDYGRGHSITQREVAALLRKKLHIHPRCIAIGKRRVKGYYANDFFQKQIFERILGRDPLLRSQSKTTAKSTVNPKRAKARKRKAR
jgi:putative DNA primase/helicase